MTPQKGRVEVKRINYGSSIDKIKYNYMISSSSLAASPPFIITSKGENLIASNDLKKLINKVYLKDIIQDNLKRKEKNKKYNIVNFT